MGRVLYSVWFHLTGFVVIYGNGVVVSDYDVLAFYAPGVQIQLLNYGSSSNEWKVIVQHRASHLIP